MTSDELKAHRRAICEALIEGKQCQVLYSGSWIDQSAETIACNLFRPDGGSMEIRIKPTPRKCWVAWSEKGSFWCATTEAKKREVENDYPNITINWQLVTEEVK